jgi:hypothetical protein
VLVKVFIAVPPSCASRPAPCGPGDDGVGRGLRAHPEQIPATLHDANWRPLPRNAFCSRPTHPVRFPLNVAHPTAAHLLLMPEYTHEC